MDTSPLAPGLYIVATPIGNLGDMTRRATDTLGRCDLVACEDTRVTGKLLNLLGLHKPMRRYDDHASDGAREALLAEMAIKAVALVSDAGTPLISDPGYKLVREARARGVTVTSLPGASAVVTALSMAGLPTDRFLFAGFLPNKEKARGDVLTELSGVPATLAFYETGPRLVASLEAIAERLPRREVAVARELTKLHEECRTGSAAELAAHYSAQPPKGEIVLLIAPPGEAEAPDDDVIDAELRAALTEMSTSQAAGKVAKAHGLDRKALYARAMALKE
ncbi:16S rRNA (cytidine(1402)-2'-O)-methyltransferase [Novosphingobium sp. ERW19]|uniref:16S rRNA (cytidine(1402)-2'-O)-methyltransferase n=1 Tax=Novosphingobium sp. ERW19 TaxID=2726186 RepID=UPI001456E304|nr:16S rRNA (cytidine(1402)-2'-O)-methyltransferase [Novosphingobium sp. ERW19]MBA4086878.1 16S rRNA (cytidine(1402)-2'-O)-methyltransferase [Novosphingobium sp.]NLR38396.1 16S rRNA (cytidine(1402)-2'-O)-methyltransferase [Novosphingobium sp. ERW19]